MNAILAADLETFRHTLYVASAGVGLQERLVDEVGIHEKQLLPSTSPFVRNDNVSLVVAVMERNTEWDPDNLVFKLTQNDIIQIASIKHSREIDPVLGVRRQGHSGLGVTGLGGGIAGHLEWDNKDNIVDKRELSGELGVNAESSNIREHGKASFEVGAQRCDLNFMRYFTTSELLCCRVSYVGSFTTVAKGLMSILHRHAAAVHGCGHAYYAPDMICLRWLRRMQNSLGQIRAVGNTVRGVHPPVINVAQVWSLQCGIMSHCMNPQRYGNLICQDEDCVSYIVHNIIHLYTILLFFFPGSLRH